MALSTANLVTRMLLMQRRGLDRSDALKYALVLSANDTNQQLTITDAVVTDVIARRKVDNVVVRTGVVSQADTNEPQVVRTMRQLSNSMGRVASAQQFASRRSLLLELLQLLLFTLQILRDPAQQQVLRRFTTSPDDLVKRLNELVDEVKARLAAIAESDDDLSADPAETATTSYQRRSSTVHVSFEVREMQPSDDRTAIYVTFEDTSVAEGDRSRAWDFGEGYQGDDAYESQPTFSYDQPGRYHVSLKIVPRRGKAKVATQVIHVPRPEDLLAN